LRTLVIHRRDESAVPFLRGILIRSLLDAGLEFDAALELATRVRSDLENTPEVTSEALHDLVLDLLRRSGHSAAVDAYQTPVSAPAPIEVHSLTGHTSPFSRGRHARYLQSAGMKNERAELTTNMVYDHLLASGITSLTTCELGYLTYVCLLQEVSKKAAHRYLVWSAYQRSGRPLILMICGTVGSGKSTVAADLSHLLDIVRTQSTDMLREVMRMMIPARLLPVLHESSFNAWKALPVNADVKRDRDVRVAEGYRSQAELLAVPCEAVIQRTIEESEPLILEGVHAHPELPQLIEPMKDGSDAIVVHVTLAVLKRKDLKTRLRGRGVEVPKRRSERYLDGMGSIWSLQSYLLSEADRCDTTIIANVDKDKCITQIIRQVNFELSRHFKGSPLDVFGTVAQSFKDKADCAPWQELNFGLRG
jgi:2-phosphoglycerate kinase